MAKEDELKKQAATAKQIKTKLDNRIMKMSGELKKEKEDNDSSRANWTSSKASSKRRTSRMPPFSETEIAWSSNF